MPSYLLHSVIQQSAFITKQCHSHKWMSCRASVGKLILWVWHKQWSEVENTNLQWVLWDDVCLMQWPALSHWLAGCWVLPHLGVVQPLLQAQHSQPPSCLLNAMLVRWWQRLSWYLKTHYCSPPVTVDGTPQLKQANGQCLVVTACKGQSWSICSVPFYGRKNLGIDCFLYYMITEVP
jgi:hypothetical protein